MMASKKKPAKKKIETRKKPIKIEKSQQRLTDLPDLAESKTKVLAGKVKVNIEAKNAMEEVREILSPCIKCGMCKSLCPVFKTLKREEISPRGHSIMLSDNILNDLVFQCNLCKACELKCPLNLKICDAMKKAREAYALEGNELATNKEMIEAIRKTGSPFEGGKSDPDKLYCC